MGTRKVVSQPQKILNFLNTGKSLSIGQARSRLGIQNSELQGMQFIPT